MKLELIDGSFAYEHSGLVLNQVSFSAEEGETVAVLGPNGIGKTTLLRCLLGFLKLQKGEIRINGRPRSDRIRSSGACVHMFRKPAVRRLHIR